MPDMSYCCNRIDKTGLTAREAATAPAQALFDHELVGLVLDQEPDSDWCGFAITSFELFASRALSPVTSEEISAGCDLPAPEAERLAASIELARRLLWPDDGPGPIRSPRDARRAAASIRSAAREHFLALYLNARNVIIHEETVSSAALTPALSIRVKSFAQPLPVRRRRSSWSTIIPPGT